MIRRIGVLSLSLVGIVTGITGQALENADKADVVKTVVISELNFAGYKRKESVCFSTREKPAVEKEIVSSLRSSKLSIVRLPLCAKRLTRSAIDIESSCWTVPPQM